MDWEARFESNLFKIYYRQVSIFRAEPAELDSFIDRLEREQEHVVSVIQDIGATETDPLLTRASAVNGSAAITRKS